MAVYLKNNWAEFDGGQNIGAPTFGWLNENYAAAASTYFAALPTQPSTLTKSAYNSLWANYPSVMSSHDLMYLNVAEYEDNKRTSLVNPSFYQSKISTPVFTKFGGVSGGTGIAYDSGFIPSTHGVNCTLNNACFWVYNAFSTSTNLKYMAGCSVAGEGGQMSAYFTSNPSFGGGLNTYAEINKAITADQRFGLWSITKVGTDLKTYRNGVLMDTLTKTSLALPNVSFYELAMNLAGVLTLPYTAGGEILGSGIGSGSINQLDLYNAVENAIGNIPTWKFYGDSITAGYNLTYAQAWATLLTGLKGYSPYNKAISGTTVKNFIDSGATIAKKGFAGQKLFLNWGLNDCVEALGTVAFKANYQTVITAALAKGWSVSDIVIVKKWYITDVAVSLLYPAYVTAAQEIATTNGITNCLDLSGLTYGLTDTLHPNAAGSITIANYLNTIV